MRAWHLFNLLVITPDFLFIILRPHSLTGGSLAHLFPLFNYYATKDALFADVSDRTTRVIYFLGGLDVLVILYFVLAPSNSVRFALLCLCREVAVATKTAVYVLYSYYYIVPSWRVGTTIMNSSWVYIPLINCYCIVCRIVDAMQGVSKEQNHSHIKSM